MTVASPYPHLLVHTKFMKTILKRVFNFSILICISVFIFGCTAQTQIDLPSDPNLALQTIAISPNPHYIAPLLDLYKYNETQANFLLQTITNENFTTLLEWKDYCSVKSLDSPKGYMSWKIDLLRKHSPHIPQNENIEPDFRLENVYIKEFDTTIRALQNPLPVMTGERISVTIHGEQKAYDFAKLKEHYIIDDVVGNASIAIAYCDICNIPVVYNTTTTQGNFTFQPTNLVYRDNSLMYDEQTLTIWNSVTGRPVMGELVGKNIELEILAFSVLN
jgi:hypothetical protein